MLGAAAELKRAVPGIEVDAAVGRQVSAGTDVLRARLAAGPYDTVIVQLGNNGPVSAKQFDALMKTLASVRRVIVVNVTVPRAWQNTNNTIMAQGIKSYPNAVLLDWNVASASHGDYFWKDGVHLRPSGAQIYASLIADDVNAP
jgi:lysophospholipase L1-like esterase